jgi:hypothetical protein
MLRGDEMAPMDNAAPGTATVAVRNRHGQFRLPGLALGGLMLFAGDALRRGPGAEIAAAGV